jgi:adenine-specific DNA-methyltransferase
MDEIFGSENFITEIIFKKTGGEGGNFLGVTTDYILWFGKNIGATKFRRLFREKEPGKEGAVEYNNLELTSGEIRRLTPDELNGRATLPADAKVFATWPIVSPGFSQENSKPIPVEHEGKSYVLKCPSNRHWSVGVVGTRKLWDIGRLLHKEGNRIFKRYLSDFSYTPLNNVWLDSRGELGMEYVVQTSTSIVERCLLMTTDPGDLVLDPTCGSGTTAYVAEQWGRRWITIDTSRIALNIAKTRLTTATFHWYSLYDPSGDDVRQGFHYKKVPHVTLGSLAKDEPPAPSQ